MRFFFGVGKHPLLRFLVGNLMKHTIEKKRKSNWMRLKLMNIFLMIFFQCYVRFLVGRWQMTV